MFYTGFGKIEAHTCSPPTMRVKMAHSRQFCTHFYNFQHGHEHYLSVSLQNTHAAILRQHTKTTHVSIASASERLNREQLALLHLRGVAILDNWHRFAGVDAPRSDRVAVEVADGLHYSSGQNTALKEVSILAIGTRFGAGSVDLYRNCPWWGGDVGYRVCSQGSEGV